MNLLIVRHAESEGNASGNYSTAQADSLSAQGGKQALALAASLSTWSFDVILASPLQRAQQTIAPYLAATRQVAEIWPEMAEACWHDERELPGELWHSEPARLHEPTAHLFRFRDGIAVRPAHPETFGTGLRRVICALERIEDQYAHTQKSILMVTHGHFIRELLNLMLKPASYGIFPHDNCGMTLMQHNGTWTEAFQNRPLVNVIEGGRTLSPGCPPGKSAMQ